MNYLDPNDYWGRIAYAIGASVQRAMSPEGRLLRQLEAAEAMCSGEADITDELRCHLRRIDKENRHVC